MQKHIWIKEGKEIDIFAFEEGEFHNGPKCSVCGFGFCHHCYSEGYDTNCPCNSLDSDNSKLDLSFINLGKSMMGK